MTQKEQKKEDEELAQAVRVLRATLRSIAQRKARRYEIEFMCKVRNMIDKEISDQVVMNECIADHVAGSVKNEIMKD